MQVSSILTAGSLISIGLSLGKIAVVGAGVEDFVSALLNTLLNMRRRGTKEEECWLHID